MSYMGITAEQIRRWPDKTIRESQYNVAERFPVFVRRTLRDIFRNKDPEALCHFHGNGEVFRKGWDGIVETNKKIGRIPAGKSFWELSVQNENGIAEKFYSDLEKRAKQYSAGERAKMSVVLATPRRFSNKEDKIVEWQKDEAVGGWKELYIYDNSDWEQLLEEAPLTRLWFLKEIGEPTVGVKLLKECWADWVVETYPPLSKDLFFKLCSCAYIQQKFEAFLQGKKEVPLVIRSHSCDEALAFLYHMLELPRFDSYHAQALVFDNEEAFQWFTTEMPDVIAVVRTEKMQKVLRQAPMIKGIIVVCGESENVDVELSRWDENDLASVLQKMQISGHDSLMLARDSGGALSVLHRRIAKSPGLLPPWANHTQLRRKLVPFALLGLWEVHNPIDQKMLSFLADAKFETLEEDWRALLRCEDSPVWQTGMRAGLISARESLQGIRCDMTTDMVKRFFDLTKAVLLRKGYLRLPAVFSQCKEYIGSDALRLHFADVVAFLAIEGKDESIRSQARKVAREVLFPMTAEHWGMLSAEVSRLAEALTALEVMEAFDSHSADLPTWLCTSAKWAVLRTLEKFAWRSDSFEDAVYQLTMLANLSLDQSKTDTPLNSLKRIFSAWNASTSVSEDVRLDMMKKLTKTFPAVGWQICLAAIEPYIGPSFDVDSRPIWGLSKDPIQLASMPNQDYIQRAKMLLLAQQPTTNMLCALISKLGDFDLHWRDAILEKIDTWRKSTPKDEELAKVCNALRDALWASAPRSGQCSESDWVQCKEKLKKLLEALTPTNLIDRYGWLFHRYDPLSWENQGEIDNGMTHEEYMKQLRVRAVEHILAELGVSGLFALMRQGAFPFVYETGIWLASAGFTQALIEEVCIHYCTLSERCVTDQEFIAALMMGLSDSEFAAIYEAVRKRLGSSRSQHLLDSLSWGSATYPIPNRVWTPDKQFEDNTQQSQEEVSNFVQWMLKAGRPWSAGRLMFSRLEDLPPRLLFQLLEDMVKNQGDRQEGCSDRKVLEKAFDLLSQDVEVPLADKARLEFAHLDTLLHPFTSEVHLPNMEVYVEEAPQWFAEIVADPKKQGYWLCEQLYYVPGHALATPEERQSKLLDWVEQARKYCQQRGCLQLGDTYLGMLLSPSPDDSAAERPGKAVELVNEMIDSEDFRTGVLLVLSNAKYRITSEEDQTAWCQHQIRHYQQLHEDSYLLQQSSATRALLRRMMIALQDLE